MPADFLLHLCLFCLRADELILAIVVTQYFVIAAVHTRCSCVCFAMIEILTDDLKYEMYEQFEFITDKTSNTKYFNLYAEFRFLHFISTPFNHLLLRFWFYLRYKIILNLAKF